MVTRIGNVCWFQVIYPSASRVFVVGDFNQWSTTAVAMEPAGRGLWEAKIELPPGTYRFRYFADGQWINDFAAFGLEQNRAGQWNSILWIPDENHSNRLSDHAVETISPDLEMETRVSAKHQPPTPAG